MNCVLFLNRYLIWIFYVLYSFHNILYIIFFTTICHKTKFAWSYGETTSKQISCCFMYTKPCFIGFYNKNFSYYHLIFTWLLKNKYRGTKSNLVLFNAVIGTKKYVIRVLRGDWRIYFSSLVFLGRGGGCRKKYFHCQNWTFSGMSQGMV